MNTHLQAFNRLVSDYHCRGTAKKPPGQSLSKWVNHLAKEYHDTGCAETKNSLVLSNSKAAAQRVISCYYRRVCRDVDMVDFFHEVLIAIGKVADRFDPGRGCKFSTYAHSYILQSASSYADKTKTLVRRCKHSKYDAMIASVQKASARQEALTGERISDEEVYRMLDETSLKTRKAIVEMMHSRERGLAEEDSMHDYEDIEKRIEVAIDSRKIMGAALEMDELSLRDRYILENRILADVPETLAVIGEKYNLTRERVRQLESNLIKKIRRRVAA